MIPKECKRLAEVDFPLSVVSKHAVHENSVRHGHPKNLHLWWARRPLAACRAMLLALLLPEPCDENCPAEFKQKAVQLLARIPGKVKKLASTGNDRELHDALLTFIGDFANWNLSSNKDYVEVARGLVRAAYGSDPPLVVDPFSGGGSIPLEASRLECEVFASDLNPVAHLIEKTLLQDIPRQGPALANELRRVGDEVRHSARKELLNFYPDDSDGAKPIAYLWARTIRCETPNCGAEIPLIRSLWLSMKAGRRRALRYKCVRTQGKVPSVEFEVFDPTSESDVLKGTVARARATCVCCNTVLPPERVRAQLREQRGGANVIFDPDGYRLGGARLIAVATLRRGDSGRNYRLADERDYRKIWSAAKRLEELNAEQRPNGIPVIPDEPVKRVPVTFGVINVWVYGMSQWADLFTKRQTLSLVVLAKTVRVLPEETSLQRAVKLLLGLAIDKTADLGNALAPWKPDAECPVHLFSRQAIGMAWDWAESVAIGDSSGSFKSAYERTADAVEAIYLPTSSTCDVQLLDSRSLPLPHESTAVFFTDPPYYDAVPYSYISDFFYVWLKRSLGTTYASIFREQLTNKSAEIVAYLDAEGSVEGAKRRFESMLTASFKEARMKLADDGVGCIVFAHKTTEGWEALLSGMIGSGWVITAAWPIATELASRMRARESATLATSVHLVCRPRLGNSIGDWGKTLRELPHRVANWMERLQSEGVRGADLVFACIGPALEIYSQYEKVVDAEEREIPLGGNPEAKEAHVRGYLAYVWEVVGRIALEQVLGTAEAKAQNGAAGALEEDARLTALFLWALQSTNSNEPMRNGEEMQEGEEIDTQDDDEDEPKSKKQKGFTLIYDVARRFAQPLGIHLEDWEDRIIETKKGVVRLLPISERAKQLFGEDGMQSIASELERGSRDSLQMSLYSDLKKRDSPKARGRRSKTRVSSEGADRGIQTRWEPTTLDRVHSAMLLQASGRANALRALLVAEQERGPDFLRLANALSALYPKDAEEKRLLDAMLLAVPR
jgi:putative DNA methylase